MKMKQSTAFPAKKNEYDLCAYTPNSVIKYSCATFFLETQYLERFMNKSYFDKLCHDGCPNYGSKWSCPPYSPDYCRFVKDYKYINVVMLLVNLEEFSYINQGYLKVRAANSVLKSRIDRALRFSKNNEEFYISTGSCRLCKPCKKKLNEKCAHPNEHTYSFEALGINVSALTVDLFETELLWYKQKNLPEYTCVVGGLLTNCETNHDKVIEYLKKLG